MVDDLKMMMDNFFEVSLLEINRARIMYVYVRMITVVYYFRNI